jgi:hypothetical protein
MIRELQVLDRELSKEKNVTVIRKDFTMFGHNFQRESAAFLRDVEKIATKEKKNSVTVVVSVV